MSSDTHTQTQTRTRIRYKYTRRIRYKPHKHAAGAKCIQYKCVGFNRIFRFWKNLSMFLYVFLFLILIFVLLLCFHHLHYYHHHHRLRFTIFTVNSFSLPNTFHSLAHRLFSYLTIYPHEIRIINQTPNTYFECHTHYDISKVESLEEEQSSIIIMHSKSLEVIVKLWFLYVMLQWCSLLLSRIKNLSIHKNVQTPEICLTS